MSSAPQPVIGQKIYWRHDSSEYIYEGVLYGETSRSWIVWNNHKLPKKTTVLTTADDYVLFTWQQKHRYGIKNAVDSCSVAVLKKVAEVLGYEGS